MVLLPSVTSEFDLAVIAAGGFLDGRTMAAALALGAEGVQLGTVMVSAAESPVHPNWKQAVLDATETGTVFLNRCDYLDPALAWTGVKNSGRGCTLSRVGFEQLTRPKSYHFKVTT